MIYVVSYIEDIRKVGHHRTVFSLEHIDCKHGTIWLVLMAVNSAFYDAFCNEKKLTLCDLLEPDGLMYARWLSIYVALLVRGA